MTKNRLLVQVLLTWLLLEVVAAAQVRQDGDPVLWHWLRALGRPIVGVSSWMQNASGDLATGLADTLVLSEEVQTLREELSIAQARVVLLEEQVETLGAAQELSSTLRGVGHRGVVGRCIYRDLVQGRLEVDAGSADGILPDTPVLAADGVVGRVVALDAHRSWVEAITHPAAAAAVQTDDATVAGIATGTGERHLRVQFVIRRAQVLRGTMLVTSGADGIYPPGLPVARITSIRETDDPFLDVLAAPAVDLVNLRVVLLIPSVVSATPRAAR